MRRVEGLLLANLGVDFQNLEVLGPTGASLSANGSVDGACWDSLVACPVGL